MKSIPLGNSKKVILVDDEDYEYFSQWRWTALRSRKTYYAIRGEKSRGTVYLHREILGLVKGDPHQADHINHNGLDNRRCNLRIVTPSQNTHHKAKPRKVSGYIGIRKRRSGYIIERSLSRNTEYYLKIFRHARTAARQYDVLCKNKYGDCSLLNFQ